MENDLKRDELIRRSGVERWILTESACIDTPADRDAVVERMRYSIPAVDAVEVVRCGECIHSEKCMILEGILEGLAYNGIHIVSRNSIARMYCPFGKRREEAET